MALDPSEYIPVDGSDEPAIPADLTLAEDATVLFTLPRLSPSVTPFTYKLTLSELRGFLSPKVIVRPAISFVSPVQASQVIIGTPTLLQAIATSAVGIAQVEFFLGSVSLGLGQVAGDHYTLPFTPAAGGYTVNLLAKATDTAGVTNTASLFVFSVPAPIVGPVVNITAPVGGTHLVSGTSTLLQATASHASGISTVEFFLGSASIGVAALNNDVYALAYTMPSSGYVLNITAKATSVSGLTAISAITVFLDPVASTLPMITGFTPTTGVAGTSVTLTGTRVFGATSVTVGGVAATSFTVLDDTSVRLVVPDFGASTGTFAVTTPAGTGKSAGSFLLATPPPVVSTSPTYHGPVDNATPVAAEVQAQTPDQWKFAPREVVFSCNGTYPMFAEPASYPVRSIILDKNGFNVTTDLVRTTQLLSIGGSSVSYTVYTHANPQYDANFILSF